MAEQGLHHREIDPGLGQGRPERVPQGMRMPAGDPAQPAVIAEDRAQPGRGQRPAPAGALGHQEQPAAARLGAFGEQVNLDHRRDIGIQRHPPFPAALAGHLQPPAADIGISDVQAQHLSRAQPAIQHQPRDRPVPPGAETGQQPGGVGLRQRRGQPPGLPQPQRRAVLRAARRVREHPGALTGHPPAGLPALRDRVLGLRVPHRHEREQARDRSQPPVDRRGRVLIHPAARHHDHIRPRAAREPCFPAGPQEPQQHLRGHLGQLQIHRDEPPAERQQVIPVGPHGLGRVIPVSQIRQILIHQHEPRRSLPGQRPAAVPLLKPKTRFRHHEEQMYQR